MYYGLYLSAAGAFSQSQKVDVLSNNLANVDTVGFKRELALLEARDSESIERGQDVRGSRGLNDIGGGVRMTRTATSYEVGTLRSTGIDTDFAIDRPETFFQVQRGEEKLLTRAGNFRISGDGRLQTQEGDNVLATDGSPIILDGQLPWRMLPGGLIQQAGDTREIGLRKAQDTTKLQKVSQNYFSAAQTNTQPAGPDDRSIRNGYVEHSTVNPMQEMVELIATQRGYETNIKMIQNHDSIVGSLISRMLRG